MSEETLIERPAENYREEEVAETIGSLAITRVYGIVKLPRLNIEAYIPSYFLVKELVATKDTQELWKMTIGAVNKFVAADGKIVPHIDVENAIDPTDMRILDQAVGYCYQQHRMTTEKKSS